ncbi:DUF2497 domain-containing protein [Methylocapsa polymorpha]|uniref:DUF2497 domain-containing protein n=1 Tax=Methylocapsa polymorpha TaxID=3080828 RepID=A0ABZ0HQH4_9HYPH|nr:DUF2497 domain-containing protein [Methylocapsa sp. RX1]
MSGANPLPKTSHLPEPRAHEPSMEEILLSIRRIIADDQALFASRDALPAETSQATAEVDAETSDFADAAYEPRLDHAPDIRALEGDQPSASRPLGKEASAKPNPAASATVDLDAPPHLLSPAADASVASAFNALVASRFVRNSDAIAALTHEMLRPMLKAWLDDNLPALVERLVQAEIERLAQGD